MSMKIAVAAVSIAAFLPLIPIEAQAVTQSAAKNICINQAAIKHNSLRGNVHINRARIHSNTYEFGLVINDAQFNCIVTKGGKVRYLG
ncbi:MULTISPECIES: hypothetical protein [Kaistia]|uniref:PepSY domain-containing protein n=1 Tax=Kaistia nematophila TaxID=2994654 RepID=A0A9X3EE67_9HYPH|nr:hypothetical protein [Kaistia nematophila]MBN9026848.1 hypothetical protein [Hyphomicrobiales bacterium]MCX5571435.1 hypothetical protein [Kaistia nematophila]